MTEKNQNTPNKRYDTKMTRKYKLKIKDGNLYIGNAFQGAPDVTNLQFLEKFDILTLNIHISNGMIVQLRNNMIKELTMLNFMDDESLHRKLNLNVDDLELENLEVLVLLGNNLDNDQLFNLVKFKKLRNLIVSGNNVDLTHIHSVISLTNLTMRQCEMKNIDQIVQLVNLQVLDVSSNLLQNIDSLSLLVNLQELYISDNEQLDIAPLSSLVGLVQLDLSYCGLSQVCALKPLINLRSLNLSYCSNINITGLQYLKGLTYLNLNNCDLVSICVLRPLQNLETLNIESNKIVYLGTHLNQMKNLQQLGAECNLISDFSSLEKHKNFNNVNEYGFRCFGIPHQANPLKEERCRALKFSHIEDPNIQLRLFNNKRKTLQTVLNSFQQKINAVLNYKNHLQFTFSAAQLFEQMNQTISQ
ncbi:Conserved_hypothetical protein [Hexamita inflata]|uniref:Uncharacterized protein n=1 Tax=Hexamita inflata TaxID=28002 RepID=A0AA86USY0_9EUKA|nr:Conserved hypothetical protein [Hexamita inflata]CAI9970405.1 Conserved hypothetical protein [Hexamita inflata]